MNTKQNVFILGNKLSDVQKKNKGVITLLFFDNSKITVNFLKSSIIVQKNKTEANVVTFTLDKNKTISYDMFKIKDVE
ncbi:MAG: hypothetical protein WCH34_00900 [Bacteroidota bacterium]